MELSEAKKIIANIFPALIGTYELGLENREIEALKTLIYPEPVRYESL